MTQLMMEASIFLAVVESISIHIDSKIAAVFIKNILLKHYLH
jgi:hypothetical protein